jgi:hypothetical protein
VVASGLLSISSIGSATHSDLAHCSRTKITDLVVVWISLHYGSPG